MRKILLMAACLLFAFLLLFSNCKKSGAPEIYIGTVIGFDQCNGRPTDSSAQGYAIKIEKVVGKDTIVADSAMTYNLPKVFVFHPQLFELYQFTYLFPPAYQNIYKFRFSYKTTATQDRFLSLCTSDILIWPIEMNGKQITITDYYGIIK